MGNNVTSFHPRQGEMTPDRALEILYDTLTQQTTGLTGHLSYSEWCRRLGLPRNKLDRYLRKELGCSGQELVSKLYSSR